MLYQPNPKKRPSFVPTDIKGIQCWYKAGDLMVYDTSGKVVYWGNKVEPWYKKYPRLWRAKFKVWVESWPY